MLELQDFVKAVRICTVTRKTITKMLPWFLVWLFLSNTQAKTEIEELYGNGEYVKKPSIFAHLSSSIEDLKKLLEIEKSIVKTYKNNVTFVPYFQEIEYP